MLPLTSSPPPARSKSVDSFCCCAVVVAMFLLSGTYVVIYKVFSLTAVGRLITATAAIVTFEDDCAFPCFRLLSIPIPAAARSNRREVVASMRRARPETEATAAWRAIERPAADSGRKSDF